MSTTHNNDLCVERILGSGRAMKIIQIEVSDALAERLRPYEDKLADLLELGLSLQADTALDDRERVFQALKDVDGIVVPATSGAKRRRQRHTPVPASGRPASEIVIQDRGPL